MEAALGPQTAAIFYLAVAMNDPESIPLVEIIRMAHQRNIPVIVDAASECPPLSTLSRFCDEGADLVIFSGGKSLAGPQSSGLVVGRPELVAACAANGNPFASVGRPMKISREEVVGLMTAGRPQPSGGAFVQKTGNGRGGGPRSDDEFPRSSGSSLCLAILGAIFFNLNKCQTIQPSTFVSHVNGKAKNEQNE